jgi:hypothetical protein
MKSFLEVLESIRTLLLENIKVFNEGYAYARADSKKGIVLTTGNEAKYVGLNDVVGDYFYSRVPDSKNAATGKSKSDCGITLLQKYNCTLVAAVSEADEFSLMDAIVNELLKTRTVNVKASRVDAIAIIEHEFKGLGKAGIDSVKARLGERILVSVDFEITRTFETHNCEYKICKSCWNS